MKVRLRLAARARKAWSAEAGATHWAPWVQWVQWETEGHGTMGRTIIRKAGAATGGIAGAKRPAAAPASSDSRAAASVVPWRMERIEDATGQPRPGARQTTSPPLVAPVRPPEEELARIRAQAHAQGHAQGLAEGQAAARAAGAREIAELGLLLGRLREVMDGFEQALSGDVLSLAIELARQIIRHTIHVHPEVVLPVIREAIAGLPQGSQHPRLLLHPDDAALLRSVLDANQIAPAPWRIVEDAKLERGGCRIETSASELDATVGSRWKAVVAALGSEERWVELDAPPRSGTAPAGGDARAAPPLTGAPARDRR